jgi:hypothetical protein
MARGQMIVKPLYMATAEIDRVAARIYGDEMSFSGVKEAIPILTCPICPPCPRASFPRGGLHRRLMRAIFAAEIEDPKAVDYIR